MAACQPWEAYERINEKNITGKSQRFSRHRKIPNCKNDVATWLARSLPELLLVISLLAAFTMAILLRQAADFSTPSWTGFLTCSEIPAATSTDGHHTSSHPCHNEEEKASDVLVFCAKKQTRQHLSKAAPFKSSRLTRKGTLWHFTSNWEIVLQSLMLQFGNMWWRQF